MIIYNFANSGKDSDLFASEAERVKKWVEAREKLEIPIWSNLDQEDEA